MKGSIKNCLRAHKRRATGPDLATEKARSCLRATVRKNRANRGNIRKKDFFNICPKSCYYQVIYGICFNFSIFGS